MFSDLGNIHASHRIVGVYNDAKLKGKKECLKFEFEI